MTRALAVLFALTAIGCRPDLGDPVSIVTGPRILALRGDPPESRAGDPVTYRALVASPAGTEDAPPIVWAFCASPLPLDENDTVSAACLGDAVRPIGGPSPTASATTPIDACALFGPDPPPGTSRPHDPDETGGFYQPVRAEFGQLTAFYRQRVPCDLPDAPVAAAIDLEERYQLNHNPTLAPLGASVAGAAVAIDEIPTGAEVQLSTGWGDADAERYVMFDPASLSVIERREAIRVAWFVTAGTLAEEVTGRGEDDPATTTSTTWTAPATPGTVHLWLVLTDSRGGTDFAGYDLTLR